MVSPNISQHLLTAGIALALACAVLVATQRHNRAAHRWLALFLVCMALLAASESLGIGARQDPTLLRWQGFMAWSTVALAPALFMYVRHLLSAQPLPWPRLLLHFAPALLLAALLLAVGLEHADPEFWRAGAQLRQEQGLRTPGFLSALLALQWAGYGAAAWQLLQGYRKRLTEQYSNIDQRHMGWLAALIACLPVLLLLWLLARVGGAEVAALIDTLYVPVGVVVLATLALRQPAVLLEPMDPQPPAPGARLPPPPASTTSADAGGTAALVDAAAAPPAASATPPADDGLADEARWAALHARLEDVLRTERPYLDDDLSLAALAAMLPANTHHLSHVLNRRIGRSFYDIINEKRVLEVQRCLHDAAYDHQSILAIGLSAGFSSKATFNAAFRRHAGTTPSDYRQARPASRAAP